MTAILEAIDALEAALVSRGFPAMSPWWRETIATFYQADRRQLVLRVGRRGGKSSSLCRVAVAEAIAGAHDVPPGDVGVVAIVSVSRDEANQRLRTIRAILDALGFKYRPVDGGIELVDRPIIFKVFSATLGGASGFTSVAVIADEVAKWRDLDSGANPAREVLASLRPTMATQPNAKIFLSSSPLSTSDAHATAFDIGSNEFQQVAFAPSWIANPTLSEEETRASEPDPRIWAREYGAIPQAGVTGAFDVDAVGRAFGRSFDIFTQGDPILVLDPSSGRKDSWTWGVARWVRPVGYDRDLLRFELVDGLDGGFWSTTSGPDVVAQLAHLAKTRGVRSVHSDQRESMMIGAEFRKQGLAFTEHAWTSASKPEAVATVRRWFAEDLLALPHHERMHRELLAFEERITASGSFTFAARGNGHDDYVSLLLTAAMADAERAIFPASYGTARVTPFAPISSQFGKAGTVDFVSPQPMQHTQPASQPIAIPGGPNRAPTIVNMPHFGGSGWRGGIF